MDAIITSIPWGGVGWAGIIIVGILAIIRGELVPRGVHEEITNDLRESRDMERKANGELRSALTLLAERQDTSVDRLLSGIAVVTEHAVEPAEAERPEADRG